MQTIYKMLSAAASLVAACSGFGFNNYNPGMNNNIGHHPLLPKTTIHPINQHNIRDANNAQNKNNHTFYQKSHYNQERQYTASNPDPYSPRTRQPQTGYFAPPPQNNNYSTRSYPTNRSSQTFCQPPQLQLRDISTLPHNIDSKHFPHLWYYVIPRGQGIDPYNLDYLCSNGTNEDELYKLQIRNRITKKPEGKVIAIKRKRGQSYVLLIPQNDGTEVELEESFHNGIMTLMISNTFMVSETERAVLEALEAIKAAPYWHIHMDVYGAAKTICRVGPGAEWTSETIKDFIKNLNDPSSPIKLSEQLGETPIKIVFYLPPNQTRDKNIKSIACTTRMIQDYYSKTTNKSYITTLYVLYEESALPSEDEGNSENEGHEGLQSCASSTDKVIKTIVMSGDDYRKFQEKRGKDVTNIKQLSIALPI